MACFYLVAFVEFSVKWTIFIYFKKRKYTCRSLKRTLNVNDNFINPHSKLKKNLRFDRDLPRFRWLSNFLLSECAFGGKNENNLFQTRYTEKKSWQRLSDSRGETKPLMKGVQKWLKCKPFSSGRDSLERTWASRLVPLSHYPTLTHRCFWLEGG